MPLQLLKKKKKEKPVGMSDTAPIKEKKKYIYELPYEIHRKLGLLLDFNDQWKDLGEFNRKYVSGP